MFQRLSIAVSAAALLVATSSSVSAAPITLDFEGLVDSAFVTNNFAGLTFSNTVCLVASGSGGTLSEADFPPFSGMTVVGDRGGAMTISFASPVDSFGGYFTYAQFLTLEAFNAGNVSLGSVSGVFSGFGNYVSTNNPPNEFLSLSAPGIAKVTITALPGGDSFTLDNFQYVPSAPGPPGPVPEPATLSLLLTGLGGTMWRVRRRG